MKFKKKSFILNMNSEELAASVIVYILEKNKKERNRKNIVLG